MLKLIRRFLHFQLGLSFVEPDAVGKTLLRAADEIEKRGHCKGDLSLPTGEICTLSSIYITEGVPVDRWITSPAVLKIQKLTGKPVCAWNNLPHQTKETIVKGLREMAWK